FLHIHGPATGRMVEPVGAAAVGRNKASAALRRWRARHRWIGAMRFAYCALRAPPLQVGRYERVVIQLGVGGIEAVDGGGLAGAQDFLGVEAMGGAHEALPAQDLVAAGDAAGKVVVDIEEDSIAVGDHAVE